MAAYIALIKFTAQGLQNIHESTHRAIAFKAAARKAGAKVTQTFWTLGAYDGAIIFEAPNDGVVTGLMVSLAALGNVQVTTMPAFTAAEFTALVEKAPKI
jgi:uncharacterized protein with GYD domain